MGESGILPAFVAPARRSAGCPLTQSSRLNPNGARIVAVLQRASSYDEAYRTFRWEVPARFNIGVAACDRHATGDDRLALSCEAPDGTVERFSFDALKR